jgi:hypothetical protein
MEPKSKFKKIISGLVCLVLLLGSYIVIDITFTGQDAKATTVGWMNEARLTNGSGDISYKDMAVWGDFVHVVWSDDRTGDYDIYYRNSSDGGFNWSDVTVLYNSSYYDTSPNIAVFQDNVHVVFSSGDGEIKYINSTDSGDTWSSIIGWDWTTYPPNLGPDAMEWPDVAVKENKVYIVGNSLNVGHIILKRSEDNGTSWSNWIQVGDFTFPYPGLSIDVTNNMLHVTADYIEMLSAHWIDHYFSDDDGDTWNYNIWNPIVMVQTIDEVITGFTTAVVEDKYCLYFSIMNESGFTSKGTFVNYTYDSNPEIWYGPVQVLSDGEGHFDAYQYQMVWGEKDANDFRQLHSNRTGQITDYNSNCTRPLIRHYGNITHVLWEDDRNGIVELYYTQGNPFISLPPAPPKSPDAGLSPGSPSDIIISWKASSDDGFGEDDVLGYTVYKSTTGVNGSYDFAAWILADDSPSYNWTEFGAGDGDLNDYFYNVRANDTLDNEEQNDIKVGKVSNHLDLGWNMFSIPLIQNNTSSDAVLQTISGNFLTLQGYHAGKSRPWMHWHKNKPNNFNDVIETNHIKGYYIKMTSSDDLVVAGSVPTSTQISLKAGWNLVGYPSLTSRTRDNAMASISGSYNKVEFFNTTSGREEGLGSSDLMFPGYGYWIHATSDCVWDVQF